MDGKYILIAGRPGSGKTELLIQYCNKFPNALFLAVESTEKVLRARGLKEHAKVIEIIEDYSDIDISEYDTICIDYIELLDRNIVQDIIKKALSMKKRVILVSQMKRNFSINNPLID